MVRYDMDVLIASVDLGVRLLTPIEGSQQPHTDHGMSGHGTASPSDGPARDRGRHGLLPGVPRLDQLAISSLQRCNSVTRSSLSRA